MLGTCAGLIMLDRDHLGLLDVSARRNAFGRQITTFEADLDCEWAGRCAACSSARRGSRTHGDEVEVLAEVDGHPVAVRQGNILAVAFHPELTDDRRVHRWLVERAGGGARRVRDQRAEALAQILVRYSTKVQKGDVCVIRSTTAAEVLVQAVYEEVLRAGGLPIMQLSTKGAQAALLRAGLRRAARLGAADGAVDRRERRRPHRDHGRRPTRASSRGADPKKQARAEGAQGADGDDR